MALIWMDHRNALFHLLRNRLAAAVTIPTHTLIQAPFHLSRRLESGLQSRHHLKQTVQQLEAENLHLHATLKQMAPLQQENAQLRQLLAAKQHNLFQATAVDVVAVDSSRFAQRILINRGSRSGVIPGQPLVDAQGIIGQVVQTSASHSQVMVISDKSSRVPVQDSRSGVETIAVGNGIIQTLSLLDVTRSVDIQVGDKLVSSGLGQRYPQGYPVARVTRIATHHDSQTVTISAKPLADLIGSRQVLLLSSRQAMLLPALSTEGAERMKQTVMAGLAPQTEPAHQPADNKEPDHDEN